MTDDDDITRNYHKGDPYSAEAFESLTSQDKERDKIRIRGLMLNTDPKRGITCDEAEDILDMSHQTCSARFSDMKKDNELMKVSERETRTGRKAGAWTLTR